MRVHGSPASERLRPGPAGGQAEAGPGRAPGERPTACHYLLQSLLAFGFMGVLLLLTYEAGEFFERRLVVAASLASTAFLVFARPRAVAARARNVLGGHWAAMAVGGAVAAAANFLLPGHAATEIVMGALSVGLATLAMTVTDTEHAPAAGTALAMVLERGQFHLVVAAVAIGSVFLAVSGRVLRRWLRDLT